MDRCDGIGVPVLEKRVVLGVLKIRDILFQSSISDAFCTSIKQKNRFGLVCTVIQ